VAAVQGLLCLVSPWCIGPRVMMTPGLAQHLARLLEAPHVGNILAWPAHLGGGQDGVDALVGSVSALVGKSLGEPGDASQQGGATLQIVLQAGALSSLTSALPAVSRAALPGPVSLVFRLVTSSTPFLAQFVEAGGLAAPLLAALLSPGNPPGMLSDALLAVSQVARVNRSHYEGLGKGRVHALLAPLLQHPDAVVRARACNLVGNLCRHSQYFYTAIEREGLMDVLVGLCSDADAATRKFACFAIGNAGFHTDLLYRHLRRAVRPLVGLLGSEEDKTLANAAGALGNLVRNSDSLCGEIVESGALEALMGVVERGEGAPQPDGSSPLKVALFSLGNMCAYPQCRGALLGAPFQALVRRLAQSPDATTQKYAQRILTKLAASSGAPAR